MLKEERTRTNSQLNQRSWITSFPLPCSHTAYLEDSIYTCWCLHCNWGWTLTSGLPWETADPPHSVIPSAVLLVPFKRFKPIPPGSGGVFHITSLAASTGCRLGSFWNSASVFWPHNMLPADLSRHQKIWGSKTNLIFIITDFSASAHQSYLAQKSKDVALVIVIFS